MPLLQHRDSPRDHRDIAQIADTQHAVHAFPDQIDEPVAFAQMKLDAGVLLEKLRQAGHQEVARQRAVNVDAKLPARLRPR